MRLLQLLLLRCHHLLLQKILRQLFLIHHRWQLQLQLLPDFLHQRLLRWQQHFCR